MYGNWLDRHTHVLQNCLRLVSVLSHKFDQTNNASCSASTKWPEWVLEGTKFFISWRLVITLTACQLVQTFLTNITKFALFVTHCQWDFQRPTWMLVSRDFQRFPEISRDFQRFQVISKDPPECLSQAVTKEAKWELAVCSDLNSVKVGQQEATWSILARTHY